MELLKFILLFAILITISRCQNQRQNPSPFEKGILSRFDVPVNFSSNSFVFPAKDTNKERENTSVRV